MERILIKYLCFGLLLTISLGAREKEFHYCSYSGPDLSIIKTEEPRENEELHIDIPEESTALGTTPPHNSTEEEPPGDDSSNQGSDGGSLWQDNSVKGKDQTHLLSYLVYLS